MQHPLEVHEAKGTGRLLHLSLTGSVLIVGETLTEAATAIITNPRRQSVLLYPHASKTSDTSDTPQVAHSLSSFVDTGYNDDAEKTERTLAGLRLIVLDATWRKSRKMLHQNALLRALPRLALNAAPPSRYAIRKAHHPHQLSTLEASCYALLQLGESPTGIHALLTSFDGFVTQQSSWQRLRDEPH